MRTIAGTTWAVEDAKRYIMNRVHQVPWSGCWLWDGCIGRTGYGKMRVSQCAMAGAGGRFRAAHRLAYEAWIEDPGKLHILHGCDVRACCNPDHMRLGTHAENMADAVERGGTRRGARWNAKLTTDQAIAIARAVESGERKRDIAARFGISKAVVQNIGAGHRWAWATGIVRAPTGTPRGESP